MLCLSVLGVARGIDIGEMQCRHSTSRMDYASFCYITVFGACLGLNVPRKLSMLSLQKSNVCFLLDSLKIKVYLLDNVQMPLEIGGIKPGILGSSVLQLSTNQLQDLIFYNHLG